MVGDVAQESTGEVGAGRVACYHQAGWRNAESEDQVGCVERMSVAWYTKQLMSDLCMDEYEHLTPRTHSRPK